MNATDNAHKPAEEAKVRTVITLPPDVFREGQKRAAGELRNFSNYVSWLIKRDADESSVGKPEQQEVGE